MNTLDRIAIVLVAFWLVWVPAAAVLAGRPVPLGGPYLMAPLVAVSGIIAGRLLAPRGHSAAVAWALLAVAAYFVAACLLTPQPGKLPLRYANANAAVGVQLLALAGLAALSRPTPPPDAPASARRGPTTRGWVLTVAAAASVGIVVVNDSKAAMLVIAPVIVAVLWAGLRRSGPPRALTLAAGALALVGAGWVGLDLAARPAWPAALLRALDPARQRLWQDALGVWLRHPVTGGGPGAFAEASLLARDPDTATAHSSLLQVGSELGVVGVALFAALLLVGLGLATGGSRAAGFIAAAAWTALAIHSFADHLYEFQAVSFTAGIMLGWASASSTPPSRDAQGPRIVAG